LFRTKLPLLVFKPDFWYKIASELLRFFKEKFQERNRNSLYLSWILAEVPLFTSKQGIAPGGRLL
jgi:hypothetical protein